jgi:regulator of protease activity HflC (stomatin/prohibitin superfamily)
MDERTLLSEPIAAPSEGYRGVVLVLFAATSTATIVAVAVAFMFGNPVLLQSAVSLGLAGGVLFLLAFAAPGRVEPAAHAPPQILREASGDTSDPPAADVTGEAVPPEAQGSGESLPSPRRARSPSELIARLRHWKLGGETADLRFIIGWLGALAIVVGPRFAGVPTAPTAAMAAIGMLVCLCGTGLAGTAVRYLVAVDPDKMPDAVPLARGARVIGWILAVAAASIGLQFAGFQSWLGPLTIGIGLVNAAVSYGLIAPRKNVKEPAGAFNADLVLTRTLGSRNNPVGSLLDAAQAQLGIDLRSTWALSVVRQSVEPLLIVLAVVAWVSTSVAIVGIDEQGLVERLGVPLAGSPLGPGIHVHLPWPIDRVFRIPVQRVQVLTVGHEGQEEAGPEDVLWARVHAPNEYTLLLGNGRDLITVDAAVQFRIADPRAWHYRSQNPADALRAIAHRAVMRTTVNKTLAEALSENLVTTTARMRAMVQEDADALGIGVEVLGFTVGGMHPPTPVAIDYQSVVSAELGKVTAIVNARAQRNRTVPYAQSEALVGANAERADAANALARAAGEAWSFLTLQSQYRAAPGEFVFRRRLETLERVLPLRRFWVVDARFQRDGGELWITP